eukprot:12161347-Prorocentrum_lima.AAC.1
MSCLAEEFPTPLQRPPRGFLVWTLAAIATRHATYGLVCCATHCKDPTSVCAAFSPALYSSLFLSTGGK